MSEESGCFDPNAMMEAKSAEPQNQQHISNSESHIAENLSLSMENLPYEYYGEDTIIATTTTNTMEIIEQPQQMENPYIHSNNNNFNIIEDVNNNNHVSFYQQFYYPTFGNSSHSFESTTHNTNTLTSLQHAFTTMPQPSRNDFVFGDGNGVSAYQDFGNEVVMKEFNQQEGEVTHTNVGRRRRGGRKNLNNSPENNTIERQKRVDLNAKFDVLKDLIPNPTRNDRASVVGDAIEYIRELTRTVIALKSLVKDKSEEKQRMIKRVKVEKGELEDNESFTSTWIQRKSKDTEVDVRIIDDEVTIKLVQRNKINCLVSVSRVLDEFKLLLQHLASAHIGDLYSFFISSKICEGSSVNASAIANKLIAVMDKSLAAAA